MKNNQITIFDNYINKRSISYKNFLPIMLLILSFLSIKDIYGNKLNEVIINKNYIKQILINKIVNKYNYLYNIDSSKKNFYDMLNKNVVINDINFLKDVLHNNESKLKTNIIKELKNKIYKPILDISNNICP